MILAPSEIHFLKDAAKGLLSPDPGTMADLSQRFQVGQERIPKVQVASKDGLWFALNNSYLHILRDLQKQGKCAQVCVEVVPLTKVPASVQEGMVVGKEDLNLWADGVTRHSSRRRPSNFCLGMNQDVLTTFEGETESAESGALYSSEACQGYQKHEVDMYGISEDCLADTALLDALDSETDASSTYSSTDYSDYFNEDDDICDTDSEYEENTTCKVCERSFRSTRSLSLHLKEKHFCCPVCKEAFASHRALQIHKTESEHWSGDADTDSGSYKEKKDSDNDDDADAQEPDELKSLL